ncbi:MAG TPA: D-alanyl-D-alanine carboxypeptidase/D-alanyl-D-alanine-endopeptidase [Gaiellaceae bacterium]|nr:D-alanyl-D-alanine carboxypeptidase/D-alanyl-D-alanine-endopeptidase [Gaiellaceae bacterium]
MIARVAAALALAAALAAASAAAGIGSPELRAKLSAALAAPGIGPGRTGAVALDLASGRVVYAHNATVPFVPASNEKLPVTYAALVVLGPSFRFPTEVRGQGSLAADGTWTGSLVLKGYGDPTLSSARLAQLARQLARLGLRRVTGGVVGDESFFDRRRTAPGWKPSFSMVESPPLSALVVDRAVTRGRIARLPAYAAAKRFRRELREVGVDVAGPASVGAGGGRLLASTESKPLGEILHAVDADSDNFTAELLLKELGAVAGAGGTSAAGAAVVRRVLGEAGIPLAGVRIVDGSGLSSLDRLTPQAIVDILARVWHAPHLRPYLVDALAVAGRTGTLAHRLTSPLTLGKVIGKTGTTDLACVLSGFVRGRYAFSVIENGTPVPFWTAREAQDRFVQLLAQS